MEVFNKMDKHNQVLASKVQEYRQKKKKTSKSLLKKSV